MNQIFSFTVVKKITEKIISQTISGDYSHATSKINTNNALKHSVDVDSGIKLYNSISSYYDSIPVTKTTMDKVHGKNMHQHIFFVKFLFEKHILLTVE